MSAVKHTKSPSGRTHQLSVGERTVNIRYVTAPQFDDQVAGDLIRKFQKIDPTFAVGRIDAPTVDPALARLEPPSRDKVERVARALHAAEHGTPSCACHKFGGSASESARYTHLAKVALAAAEEA